MSMALRVAFNHDVCSVKLSGVSSGLPLPEHFPSLLNRFQRYFQKVLQNWITNAAKRAFGASNPSSLKADSNLASFSKGHEGILACAF